MRESAVGYVRVALRSTREGRRTAMASSRSRDRADCGEEREDVVPNGKMGR
jgi:hypothetical protein